MKYSTIAIAALALNVVCLQPAWAATDNGNPITKTDLTTPVTSFPTDLVTGANQTQFANYAWRLFIAATQQTTATLSNGQGRGVGNGKNNFIDTGTSPGVNNPLVF